MESWVGMGAQKWCSCFSWQQLKARLSNKILLSAVTHSEWGGQRNCTNQNYTILEETWRNLFFSVCFVWNFSVIKSCCTWCFPGMPARPHCWKRAGFELLLVALGRLCSAPGSFLFTSYVSIEYRFLLIPQMLHCIETLTAVILGEINHWRYSFPRSMAITKYSDNSYY